MKVMGRLSLAFVWLISMPIASLDEALAQEATTVAIPQPGVPQIMTLEWIYVRADYKNEGYAIIGYRLANMSIGEPWMLIELGTTLREGVPAYTMKPDALS